MKSSRLIMYTLMLIAVGSLAAMLNIGDNIRHSEKLKIVNRRSSEDYASVSKIKHSLADESMRRKVSIEQLESELADNIIRIREESRKSNGGFYPGTFIVQAKGASKFDPNKVKIVPDGMLPDFGNNSELRKKLLGPNHLGNDKSIYLDYTNTEQTDLDKADFVGYFPEGAYLRGSNYAKTEKLQNVERTPSGKSGWTGITRLYSNYPQLGDVMFREDDNVAAHITVQVPENSINARVGRYPATIIRLQDGSGNTMAGVRWL